MMPDFCLAPQEIPHPQMTSSHPSHSNDEVYADIYVSVSMVVCTRKTHPPFGPVLPSTFECLVAYSCTQSPHAHEKNGSIERVERLTVPCAKVE